MNNNEQMVPQPSQEDINAALHGIEEVTKTDEEILAETQQRIAQLKLYSENRDYRTIEDQNLLENLQEDVKRLEAQIAKKKPTLH